MIGSYIEPKIDQIMEDFLEKYIISMYEMDAAKLESLKNSFKNLLIFTVEGSRHKLVTEYEKLARLNIAMQTPYIVLVNEIAYLKNTLADILLKSGAKTEIYDLYALYVDIENIVAYQYLDDYLKKLLEANTYRTNSLKDMLEKNVVRFYEDHLAWLSALAIAIQKLDSSKIPELNPKLCEFGKWLCGEAKSVIKNNSKYSEIVRIHKTLHDLGNVINKQLDKRAKDFNVIMSYLEKCEMISLSIGAELALIDNTLIIKKAAKDEMTGALNRNSLSYIFANQYELSLATATSFVLAMCDLDYFKKLNDTYGHVAGDMMLKEFVKSAKSKIRDSDVIIRYGGEEFAILLPNTNIVNAKNKLEEIRIAFQNTVCIFEGNEIQTTVSIGAIEIAPATEVDVKEAKVETYVAIADKKLYESKLNGRNRVSWE